MNPRILFGLSILMSFGAYAIVAFLYVWPPLQSMPLDAALVALTAPHMFRFIGLAFLLPGVVSETLPADFARPAAFGDLIAAVLAMASVLGLSSQLGWAIAIVWIFNVWGAIDLLIAMYRGVTRLLYTGPGVLGAAFFIPTLGVPALLLSHALIFWLLLRPIR